MTLDNTSLSLSFKATLNSALDLQTASSALTLAKAIALTSGTGASQADRMWSDRRTIAASTSDDLDLAGTALTDALGLAFSIARIKGLIILANAANVNNLVMGGNAAAITTILGGTNPTLTIRPGGIFALTATDATAYAVTATTADILRITNGGAGTSVEYDIVVWGSSA